MSRIVSLEFIANPVSPKLPYVVLARLNDTSAAKITAIGKGLTKSQRCLSAYGEVVERLCMYQIRADKVARYQHQSNTMIDPHKFVPSTLKHINSKIEWVSVRNLRHPTKRLLIHRPIRGSKLPKLYSHTSNGCAVGLTKSDAINRALREVLERHAFMSQWCFGNTDIVADKRSLKADHVVKQLGWRVHRYILRNTAKTRTGKAVVSCTILENIRDARFRIGGAIMGLSHGKSIPSHQASLAECIQALEVKLIGGKMLHEHRYYLERKNGAKLLKNLIKNSRSGFPTICLGQTFYRVTKTSFSIPYYAEVFVENALPINLYRAKMRIPKTSQPYIINRTPLPNPLG